MNESKVNHTYARLEPGDKRLENIMAFAVPLMAWSGLVIGIVGAIGNILNIAVYIRLGFSQTINMSYTALAVSDLFTIFSIMWAVFCHLPYLNYLLQSYQIRVDVMGFATFTGGWPHMAFSKTTALITAWISLERCFCVLFPTKVKLIITRNITGAVLVFIYVVGCFPAFLAFVDVKNKWIFDPSTNVSTLFMYYDYKTQMVSNSIANYLSGITYPLLSWVVVFLCTLLLIIKLRKSAKWRQENATEAAVSVASTSTPRILDIHRNNAYRRENRVTKTVVMIAGFFIVSALPLSLHILTVNVLRKDYSAFGSLRLLFLLYAGLTMIISEINSSINIIFYLICGSKFRSALLQLVSFKRRKR